jgi:hypothetical protein
MYIFPLLMKFFFCPFVRLIPSPEKKFGEGLLPPQIALVASYLAKVIVLENAELAVSIG